MSGEDTATKNAKSGTVAIELTYPFEPGEDWVKTEPKDKFDLIKQKLRLKKGDILTFSSQQGRLNLLFSPPKVFVPGKIKPDGSKNTSGEDVWTGDVLVAENPGADAMIKCGGVFTLKKNSPETVIPPTEGPGVGVEVGG